MATMRLQCKSLPHQHCGLSPDSFRDGVRPSLGQGHWRSMGVRSGGRQRVMVQLYAPLIRQGSVEMQVEKLTGTHLKFQRPSLVSSPLKSQ